MQEIKMPNAGQTTDEAQIVKILVKKGDAVKRGDVLMEAETDKAVLPVESYLNGTVLDIMVAEGDKVYAGTPLVVVGKPEEAASYSRGGEGAQSAAPAKTSAPEAAPEPGPAEKAAPSPAVPEAEAAEEDEEYIPIIKGQRPAGEKRPAAAAVKRPEPAAVYPAMPGAKILAKERGVALAGIVPANGKFITKKDVLKREAEGPAVPASAAETDPGAYEAMPMSRMRRAIGRRMLESRLQIPVWQCTVSINMEACTKLRAAYKDRFGVKLSYNDFLAKAAAAAAERFPLINARYENDEIRVGKHTNVGLAVAGDDALYVPVVKCVEQKSLKDVAAEYKDLIERARKGRLQPDEMGCGSITISNLGMYDVDQFIAIVNPPESCILAVGSIQTLPVWNGSTFVPAPMMTVTGSFDHRMIDGAYGAQLLKEIKFLMENPHFLPG